MKKLFSFIFLLFTLFSLTAFVYFDTQAATREIYWTISYKNIAKTVPTGQTAQETLRLKSGNCVDMSILLAYKLYKAGKTSQEIITYTTREGTGHAIVRYLSTYFDPTVGQEIEIDTSKIRAIWSVDQLIALGKF